MAAKGYAGDVAELFENSDPIVALNIGGGFDIPTGRYHKGKHGENILSGGYYPIMGVVGDGNTFKSTFSTYFNLSALNRYTDWWASVEDHFRTNLLVYDTEFTKQLSRLEELGSGFEYIQMQDELLRHALNPEGVIRITNGSIFCDDYYELLREGAKAKILAPKKMTYYTTPFLLPDDTHLKLLYPTIVDWDSFSQSESDATAAQYEGEDIGSAKRNPEALREAMIKDRIIRKLPALTTIAKYYITMTAHTGKELNMGHTPNPKQMAFLKQNIKFKNVPEKFKFLPSNVYLTSTPKMHGAADKKGPMYPRNSYDKLPGDPDMQIVTLVNLRGKGGMSGLPMKCIISQSDGYLPEVSAYEYCKDTDMYGFTDKNKSSQKNALALRPDITLTRTNLRTLMDSDRLLSRAMEITQELCQIKNLWSHVPTGFVVDADVLYTGLKERGYDWDKLLETRGWWLPLEIKHPREFLSTYDLLEMYHGTYHPYWWDAKYGKLTGKPVKETVAE